MGYKMTPIDGDDEVAVRAMIVGMSDDPSFLKNVALSTFAECIDNLILNGFETYTD